MKTSLQSIVAKNKVTGVVSLFLVEPENVEQDKYNTIIKYPLKHYSIGELGKSKSSSVFTEYESEKEIKLQNMSYKLSILDDNGDYITEHTKLIADVKVLAIRILNTANSKLASYS